MAKSIKNTKPIQSTTNVESTAPLPSVAIIGGGPAGLIAAEKLAEAGIIVDLFDRVSSLGRRFLMAGRGGLNLTHGEPLEAFLARYEPVSPLLVDAIRAFSPDALRQWCHDLGHETFVGSSGRVFPREMKASPLLRSWLGRLNQLGVRFHVRHEFRGWNEAGALVFATPGGEITRDTQATLLAVGGASWPRLGADGAFSDWLGREGVEIRPLGPANSGVQIAWSEVMRARHAGSPLKRVVLSVDGHSERGEMVITEAGLEGGVIYALSRHLREAVARDGFADIILDLRPDIDSAAIAERLSDGRSKDSLSSKIRKAAGLAPNAISLLHEAMLASKIVLPKDDAGAMARLIKALPLRVIGIADIERAISTAGGVDFSGLTPDFMLERRPGVFVAGEMLDWEAPTGGYLMQGCFATGIAAAEGIKRHLKRPG